MQQYVETFMEQADVQFVVVIDMDGIRYAHPEREKVGKAFVGGDETEALNGNETVSTSVGTLGRSLRAFTPVYAETGEQVGAVAVGISLEVVEKSSPSKPRKLAHWHTVWIKRRFSWRCSVITLY